MSKNETGMACIKCGRIKQVIERGEHEFFCQHCKITFDDNPDEGGDYCTGRPSGRLEREERRREHQRDRLGRR